MANLPSPKAFFFFANLQCKRCGHAWLPRQLKAPAMCPRCKSRYWDKPPKKTKKDLPPAS
jgi:predicted Zn-ribbon and HTH transcriptional regulator